MEIVRGLHQIPISPPRGRSARMRAGWGGANCGEVIVVLG
jgi:hypothetical protein